MVMVVEQREYIQKFIDFVGSFLITEEATVNEIELVEANLKILSERIQGAKETVIKAPVKTIGIIETMNSEEG